MTSFAMVNPHFEDRAIEIIVLDNGVALRDDEGTTWFEQPNFHHGMMYALARVEEFRYDGWTFINPADTEF